MALKGKTKAAEKLPFKKTHIGKWLMIYLIDNSNDLIFCTERAPELQEHGQDDQACQREGV